MSSALDTFQLQMGQASQLAMSITLFCMMLAVALGLKPRDFSFIKTAPRLFFAGFIGQALVLPSLTLGLCYALQPHPGIALGMLIIACCPGGNVSNILVLLARGNAALSVSLTATSSLMAAFVTPTAMLFWTSFYPPTAKILDQIELDVITFLLQTAMVLALPLVIGMLVRRYYPVFAERARKPLVLLASTALLSIIVITTLKASDLLVTVGGAIVGVVALHNALAYISGYVIGWVVKADIASRRALTFEVGIQNSGLGIVIIMSQLGGIGASAAVAGLWGLWHILAGVSLLLLFRMGDRMAPKLSN